MEIIKFNLIKKNKELSKKVIQDFGKEWNSFDYNNIDKKKIEEQFHSYFSIFPWDQIKPSSQGFDAGCGSGRWAYFVANKVNCLHCIEPSDAINVAKNNLSNYKNCKFYQCTIEDSPILENTMDFGYSLGVLHHIPDTQKALSDCVKKLKSGAPFLVYLYYSFDNRPTWYNHLWYFSNILRIVISKLPYKLKFFTSQILAFIIYLPLARIANVMSKFGFNVEDFPLSFYKDKPFYFMRTDALDRFGTKFEQRFSKKEIAFMMEKSGLKNIKFSNNAPFYCALGYKI